MLVCAYLFPMPNCLREKTSKHKRNNSNHFWRVKVRIRGFHLSIAQNIITHTVLAFLLPCNKLLKIWENFYQTALLFCTLSRSSRNFIAAASVTTSTLINHHLLPFPQGFLGALNQADCNLFETLVFLVCSTF